MGVVPSLKIYAPVHLSVITLNENGKWGNWKLPRRVDRRPFMLSRRQFFRFLGARKFSHPPRKLYDLKLYAKSEKLKMFIQRLKILNFLTKDPYCKG